MGEFHIHATGAVCHSTFVISTGPFQSAGQPSGGRAALLSLCTALDQASSLSRKLAYVPGLTFGFVKLLALFNARWRALGLRAFDLVSSRVWWEAATNIWRALGEAL